uniref:Uncharacterized protein n=1 Tax=Helianthus annuus TaxID=4232 RepID=A0A251VFL5_HELAN
MWQKVLNSKPKAPIYRHKVIRDFPLFTSLPPCLFLTNYNIKPILLQFQLRF